MKNYKFTKIASNKILIYFLTLLFAFSFFVSTGLLFSDFDTEPDEVKTHIIKENETLANISYIYYNDNDRNRGAHWLHIYEYNVMKGYINPDKQPIRKYGKFNAIVKIFVGKKLLIPIYNSIEYPSLEKLFDKYGFDDVTTTSYVENDETKVDVDNKEKDKKEDDKEENIVEIEGEDMVEIRDENTENEKTEEYLTDLIEDEEGDEELITIEDTETTVDEEADEITYPDYDPTIDWTGLFKVDYDDLKNKLIEKQGELNEQTKKLLSEMEDYKIDLNQENMEVTIYQDGEMTREGVIEDNKDGTLDLVFDDTANNIRVSVKKDENDFTYLETAFTFTTIILLAQ